MSEKPWSVHDLGIVFAIVSLAVGSTFFAVGQNSEEDKGSKVGILMIIGLIVFIILKWFGMTTALLL